MSRPPAVLLIVALLLGAALGTFQFRKSLAGALKTSQVLSGRILALGSGPDGDLRMTSVNADGTLPDGVEGWDFYLTDPQLRLYPMAMDGVGDVWVDLLETHNSRTARTVKLTVSSPRGITVCIYEGAKGSVIPKQRAVLSTTDFSGLLWSSVRWGLSTAVLAFMVLLAARALAAKRGLKHKIASSE